MYNTDILKNTDILYATRIQKERHLPGTIVQDYVIDMKYVKTFTKKIIIMHPGPHETEINDDLYTYSGFVYFRMIQNGLNLRKALLQTTINAKQDY